MAIDKFHLNSIDTFYCTLYKCAVYIHLFEVNSLSFLCIYFENTGKWTRTTNQFEIIKFIEQSTSKKIRLASDSELFHTY
jgi:hypothetical protein